MKKDSRIISAPLTMQVDEYSFIDDDTFDQLDFLQKVADSPNCPSSACPAPEYYRAAFDCGVDRAYAVTLSAELSGSCNSAQLAKKLMLEERPEMKIHVFNSRSASIGETLITQKIQECEEAGMEFEEVVETVESYIDGQNTYFVLENLETLRKNGRLSNLKAFVATALKIKPVMHSTPEGTIAQLDQARGINKALVKLVTYLCEEVEHPEEKVLAISHCNCPDRGRMVADAILERIEVKDVILENAAGCTTMYANDGGIVVVI
jgi:DegV family protein with EDD domain